MISNPYQSPAEKSVVDPQLMRSVAARLSAARQNPPTVIRAVTTWPGIPLLLMIGVVSTFAMTALAAYENSIITSHWPIGVACTIFGAILRDFGLARRVVRVWPAQAEFVDWEKVDQYVQ